MPLKYLAGWPWGVKVVGWLHGVLFVAYMLAGLVVAVSLKWSILKVLKAVIAALLPFGPFVFDKELKAEEEDLRA
jgi:integral membrane protein